MKLLKQSINQHYGIIGLSLHRARNFRLHKTLLQNRRGAATSATMQRSGPNILDA